MTDCEWDCDCDCIPCPKIYSGKCSDCPDNRAELADYFGRIERIERHLRGILALSDPEDVAVRA